jgi:S-adenosylmethionine uptake transporter
MPRGKKSTSTAAEWAIGVSRTMSAPPSSTIPFSVATLGIAVFSMMDVLMKGLSIAIGAYNAMLWRLLAGSIFAGAIFIARRSRWPEAATLRLHWLRGAVAAAMATAFFWGLARVPMAEAVALSFIAPLITLYLAAIMLGEKIGRNVIIASLLGLSGVVVILSARLSGDYQPEALKGVMAIFTSAVLYAFNLILQRKQAQIASPTEIVFFQSFTAFAVLMLFAPIFAVVPAIEHVPSIAGSAVLAMISLMLLSWAYARAEAQILVAVEYTAFIWAAIFGWLFFQEAVTWATLTGTALIVTGCIIAARQRPEHIEATAL